MRHRGCHDVYAQISPPFPTKCERFHILDIEPYFLLAISLAISPYEHRMGLHIQTQYRYMFSALTRLNEPQEEVLSIQLLVDISRLYSRTMHGDSHISWAQNTMSSYCFGWRHT